MGQKLTKNIFFNFSLHPPKNHQPPTKNRIFIFVLLNLIKMGKKYVDKFYPLHNKYHHQD